jgi:hypothetical protein
MAEVKQAGTKSGKIPGDRVLGVAVGWPAGGPEVAEVADVPGI